MNLIRRILALGFWADSEAAVATEYALLVGLIAMAIVAALTTFGGSVAENLYQKSLDKLPF